MWTFVIAKDPPLSLWPVRMDMEVSTFLLDQMANLQHRDYSNWTALALASVTGHVDTVRILMERGAGTLLAVQSETSKGSRLVTPTMARASVGRTGPLFTNSKDDSADNCAHVLSLMILELSPSLHSVTLGFGTQMVVVFACISLDQVTFHGTHLMSEGMW
jgi:ankyrin repeat protein